MNPVIKNGTRKSKFLKRPLFDLSNLDSAEQKAMLRTAQDILETVERCMNVRQIDRMGIEM